MNKITKESYKRLIDGDIEWLEKNTKESPERTHIVSVLKRSVELEYKKRKASRQPCVYYDEQYGCSTSPMKKCKFCRDYSPKIN